MSSFAQNGYITHEGQSIFTAADAGRGKITFDRAVFCTQDLSKMQPEDIRKLNNLTGQVLTCTPSVIQTSDSTVTIAASFNNSTLTKLTTFGCVGWWVKSTSMPEAAPNTDFLAAVTPCTEPYNFLAGQDGKSTAAVDVDLILGINYDAPVILKPNEVGFVTHPQLEQALLELSLKTFIFDNTLVQRIGADDTDKVLDDIHKFDLKYIRDLNADVNSDGNKQKIQGWLMTIADQNDSTKGKFQLLYKNIAENGKPTVLYRYRDETGNWSHWITNIDSDNILGYMSSYIDGIMPTRAGFDNGTSFAITKNGKTWTIPYANFLAAVTYNNVDGTRLVNHNQLTEYTYDRPTIDSLLAQAGKVKTVNNVGPDSKGNINVDTGGVKTINNQKPDSNGNANLPYVNYLNQQPLSMQTWTFVDKQHGITGMPDVAASYGSNELPLVTTDMINDMLKNYGRVKQVNHNDPDSGGNVNVDTYTQKQIDGKISAAQTAATNDAVNRAGTVKSVDHFGPDSVGNVTLNAVRTINGSTPDSNGNINISNSSGTVQSVQNIAPDNEGNVNLIKTADTLKDALTESNNFNGFVVVPDSVQL